MCWTSSAAAVARSLPPSKPVTASLAAVCLSETSWTKLPRTLEKEPEPVEEEEVLQTVLPLYIKARIYGVLRDSFAAELAARMSAMDNATRNAKELMNSLTLTMNRTRQASITKEILEVVSGAEALK